ncbi:MAG: hypothetical protein SGI99_18105 [Pseudomonadota bacterium]|nr:hypothetical protein [Pseudomonadota bacterium]
MTPASIHICGYRPELATAFATLNFSWIEALFEVEEADRKQRVASCQLGISGEVAFDAAF